MNNYLTITQNQIVDINIPIKPIEINIFFAITINYIDKLLPIIYSLEKYSESKFNVYIMLDKQNIQSYYQQFKVFQNQKINIILLDCKLLDQVLNKKHNMKLTKMAYARLLIPTLFPNLDEMLYLDYDTIILKRGIQWLYDIDFNNKDIATFCRYKNTKGEYHPQRVLFLNIKSTYFNSGVILMNLKKIREDGMDKKMIQILRNDPITSQNNQELLKLKEKLNTQNLLQLKLLDQSMLNQLFRDEDTITFNPIFNSHFMNRKHTTEDYITDWKFNSQQEYVDNIIIAHFSVSPKPWQTSFYHLDDYQKILHQKYKNLKDEMIQKYF